MKRSAAVELLDRLHAAQYEFYDQRAFDAIWSG